MGQRRRTGNQRRRKGSDLPSPTRPRYSRRWLHAPSWSEATQHATTSARGKKTSAPRHAAALEPHSVHPKGAGRARRWAEEEHAEPRAIAIREKGQTRKPPGDHGTVDLVGSVERTHRPSSGA